MHYGGHRAAGGFTLAADRIPLFRDRFLALAAQELSEEDLVHTLAVDAELNLDEVDFALVDAVARLAPHGVGNPEPVFAARQLQVMQSVRRVGRNHLKMRVRQSGQGGQVVEAIGFNFGDLVETLEGPGRPRVDLAFVPERNAWNGREVLQLRVKDLHLCPPPSGAHA